MCTTYVFTSRYVVLIFKTLVQNEEVPGRHTYSLRVKMETYRVKEIEVLTPHLKCTYKHLNKTLHILSKEMFSNI